MCFNVLPPSLTPFLKSKKIFDDVMGPCVLSQSVYYILLHLQIMGQGISQYYVHHWSLDNDTNIQCIFKQSISPLPSPPKDLHGGIERVK